MPILYRFKGVKFCFIHFQITWFDERNMVITEGVRTLHELMEDGKRFVSISVLRFRASVGHNGKKLTCQAQNSATPQPQLVSTRSVSLFLHAHNILFLSNLYYSHPLTLYAGGLTHLVGLF